MEAVCNVCTPVQAPVLVEPCSWAREQMFSMARRNLAVAPKRGSSQRIGSHEVRRASLPTLNIREDVVACNDVCLDLHVYITKNL